MTHFESILVSLVKGAVMTLKMENDGVIKGQYELTTVSRPGFKGNGDPQVCLHTERKLDYEYFPVKGIKSLTIERADNEYPATNLKSRSGSWVEQWDLENMSSQCQAVAKDEKKSRALRVAYLNVGVAMAKLQIALLEETNDES